VNSIAGEEIKKSGLDDNNRVQLVDLTIHRVTIDNAFTRSYTGVRYHHSYDEMNNTDFVLLDGPDVGKYNADTTLNLQDMVDTIGYVPAYWIDGREGTRAFYNHLGYGENEVHSRRDVYEVMKSHPELTEQEAKEYLSTHKIVL